MSPRRRAKQRAKAEHSLDALARRKVDVEIEKIKTETELMRKRFWLDVAKVVIAVGSLLATLATVANAILGT